MFTIRSAFQTAPATDPGPARAALLLCAHGSAGHPGIAAAHGSAIADRGLFEEVASCALYGTPTLDQALEGLSARRIYLVPFLLAEGATYQALTERIDGKIDWRRVTLCPPVGVHPGIVDLIEETADQARQTRGWAGAETALLLIGHGTTRHRRSATTLRSHAETLAAHGTFAQVATAFLSQAPSVPEVLAALDTPSCVAIGYFADAGQHGERDVPQLLGAAGDRVCYCGPIGVSPKVREIMIAQVSAAAACQKLETPMTRVLPAGDRHQLALDAFDAANRLDPNQVPNGEGSVAKELAYARRMTAWLDKLYPEATEALRLAARCQHIERWRIPRDDYPRDRSGYLRWRSDLKRFHAERGGSILRRLGYPEETVARVEALVRKERLKVDPEAQALEDVACLVFLETQFESFSQQHESTKIVAILRKTWRKMSPLGRAAALELNLSAEARELVVEALAVSSAPSN